LEIDHELLEGLFDARRRIVGIDIVLMGQGDGKADTLIEGFATHGHRIVALARTVIEPREEVTMGIGQRRDVHRNASGEVATRDSQSAERREPRVAL
jgi:hypothetical protein